MQHWGKNAYWVNLLITIRIFWLWSEFSDCDQIEEKNAYWVNFLITIKIFWLWSEFSDCDQIEKKSLLSEFSDHNQNFLIMIRIFWLWSNWEKNTRFLRNKQSRKTENNKQRLKTILCFDRPPRHINPGIHSGILLSVISSRVASGVLSGIKYGVLSGKSFANFTWQKFWRSAWHTFWSDWWKVRLLKICRVWVSCRDHRFCLPVCWFSPIEWKSNMTSYSIHIYVWYRAWARTSSWNAWYAFLCTFHFNMTLWYASEASR